MTFLEELQSHRGGILRLKTQLYWYDGGWDGVPDRVCLVLDASADAEAAATTAAAAEAAATTAALLLIDGCPHWIWVAQEDVELIT